MSDTRTTRAPARTPSSEFTELAQQIRDAGLMRRRYGYYWTKLILVPVVIGAAIVVFIWIGDSWWQMFTAAIFAFLFTQTAFLGHDAAHRQIFRSGRWNDWISLIIGDLFIGMSYAGGSTSTPATTPTRTASVPTPTSNSPSSPSPQNKRPGHDQHSCAG